MMLIRGHYLYPAPSLYLTVQANLTFIFGSRMSANLIRAPFPCDLRFRVRGNKFGIGRIHSYALDDMREAGEFIESYLPS